MTASGTVFDCMVFVQAISSRGTAFQCLQSCMESSEPLFVSEATLEELADVLSRPELQRKLRGITPARVEALMHQLREFGQKVDPVPRLMQFPPDPKDEPYLNLAIAAKARDLVTRDKAMLRLSEPTSPFAVDLLEHHPTLRIVVPEDLLDLSEKLPA